VRPDQLRTDSTLRRTARLGRGSQWDPRAAAQWPVVYQSFSHAPTSRNFSTAPLRGAGRLWHGSAEALDQHKTPARGCPGAGTSRQRDQYPADPHYPLSSPAPDEHKRQSTQNTGIKRGPNAPRPRGHARWGFCPTPLMVCTAWTWPHDHAHIWEEFLPLPSPGF
jgi:hypothetical protein